MGWSMFDIGCCCGGGCLACADAFTRANASDIASGAPSGCAYTQYGESAWEIVSNALHHTSGSGDSLAIISPGSGDPDEMAVRATFDVTTLSTGKRVGIVFDFVDDENYRFFDVYVTAATAGKWNIKFRYGTVSATVETIEGNYPFYLNTSFPSGIIDLNMCVHKSGGELAFYWVFGGGNDGSVFVPQPADPTLASGLIADTEYAIADDFLLYSTLAAECPECDSVTCTDTPGLYYPASFPYTDDFSTDTASRYVVSWSVAHNSGVGTKAVSGGALTLTQPGGRLLGRLDFAFHIPRYCSELVVECDVSLNLASSDIDIYGVSLNMGGLNNDLNASVLYTDSTGIYSAGITIGGTANPTGNHLDSADFALSSVSYKMVVTMTHEGDGYYSARVQIFDGVTEVANVIAGDAYDGASTSPMPMYTGCNRGFWILFDITALIVADVQLSIDNIVVDYTP